MEPAARALGTAAARLIRDSIVYEPLAVKVLNTIDYLFRCGIPYFLRQVPHLLDDRMEERLPRLEVAALVMRGEKDVICPDGWSRRVTSLLRDARFVTVPGPHVVMFTDPPRVAELIAEHAR
jgi:pimeloyl-ACP methyl ester carboxylesterase